MSGRDHVDVHTLTFPYRGGEYACVKVTAGAHEIEVTVSPTGRSVQLWANGRKLVLPVDAEPGPPM